MARVLTLMQLRDKPLVLAAVRFMRACIGLKDEFYYRYIAKNNCLLPLVQQLAANARLDNLLASAVIELLDFLRKVSARAHMAGAAAAAGVRGEGEQAGGHGREAPAREAGGKGRRAAPTAREVGVWACFPAERGESPAQSALSFWRSAEGALARWGTLASGAASREAHAPLRCAIAAAWAARARRICARCSPTCTRTTARRLTPCGFRRW